MMFEDWLKELDQIFSLMRCQYEDRVLLATYVLQGRAYDWWQSTHRVYFEDFALEDIDWESFCIVFRDRYVPQHLQDQKEEE